MCEYHGHVVSLLWQSKHARFASARVAGESHFGSATTGGFVWARPYGMTCATRNKPTITSRARRINTRARPMSETVTNFTRLDVDTPESLEPTSANALTAF